MEIGRQLGSYVLEGKLGEGGMGAVYAAKHVRIGRSYAIKVLLPELARRQEALTRFEREARALSALGHPNIVAIHDFGIDADGTAYLVMDRLEGVELGKALAGGPLDPARARRIAMDVAAGLGAAHRLGIVHRDLKPSNVFLVGRGERERAVLLDFGLAKALSEDAPVDTLLRDKLTASGAILGTPHYMSPEQARGERLDARSDVWTFGVLLYEMLTGRVPFEGPTLATVFAAILAIEPVPPSQRVAGIAPALEAIVMHALDKSPAGRPADGDALLALLEGPEAPPTRAIAAYDAPTIAATPSTPRTPATRIGLGSTGGRDRTLAAPRARAALVAAAVAGVAAAAVAVALWALTHREPPPSIATMPTPAIPRDLPDAAAPPSAPDAAVVAPPTTVAQATIELRAPRDRTHRRPATTGAPPPEDVPASTSGAPPSSEGSLVGRVPPGMESSPGARELADANDLMQNGDFAGCLRVLEHAPQTQHVLSVEMSCANAAHDHAALVRVCARMRTQFPASLFNQTCDALLAHP